MLEDGLSRAGGKSGPEFSESLAAQTITLRRSASEELHKLFEGTVTEAFQNELGIIEPGLIGHITDILDRNVSAKKLFQLRDEIARTQDDYPNSIAHQLGLMLRCCNQLESEVAPSRQLLADLYCSVGDNVLFFSGIFPKKHIEPVLNLYATQIPSYVSTISDLGESAYRRAAEILDQKDLYEMASSSEKNDKARLNTLEYLSGHFKLCVQGLRLARDQLFHLVGDRIHRGIILGS